jgi:hypothetical protein
MPFLVVLARLTAMYGVTCYGSMKVFEKVGGIPTWAVFVPFDNAFSLTTEVVRKNIISGSARKSCELWLP